METSKALPPLEGGVAGIAFLLERYHKEGYGWALACTSRNPIEAEDVLQTTYLKILSGRARFEGRGAFKTWLFSVIKNTASEMRRRSLRRRLLLMKHSQSSPQELVEGDIGDRLSRAQIQAYFKEAIRKLPRRQREVLQLVFYHEMTLREAAVVMSLSVGTARTHYERAKRSIRRWFLESELSDEYEHGREQAKRTLSRTQAAG